MGRVIRVGASTLMAFVTLACSSSNGTGSSASASGGSLGAGGASGSGGSSGSVGSAGSGGSSGSVGNAGSGGTSSGGSAGTGSPDSSNHPTDQDRAAWQKWAGEFVANICAHQAACSPDAGRSPGSENACVESGNAAADMATCEAAVEFYVAHRAALEACTSNYPPSCSLSVVDACPTMPAGDFGTLCP